MIFSGKIRKKKPNIKILNFNNNNKGYGENNSNMKTNLAMLDLFNDMRIIQKP